MSTVPTWLLCELTYTCPLHCPYCSNPLDFSTFKNELSTNEWIDVMHQARNLGAIQLGFSGGEPALRKDLITLTQEAYRLGYYTNLITSGIGLNEEKIQKLKSSGLDTIQISFQDASMQSCDYISGTKSFERKIEIARWVKNYNFPLTLNFVLHRKNIIHIKEMLDLAVKLNADYVELANTQYYGFALLNRKALLPSQEQLIQAKKIWLEYKEKYRHRMKILYVIPDYYEKRPKPCMNGWGKTFLTITPDGYALPCHAARVIKNLEFPNIRQNRLEWIWNSSLAFNRFRGFDWMKQPCQSCPERFMDFGGCRCQALLLTGDAQSTDPVCALSPHHSIIEKCVSDANSENDDLSSFVFRI